MHLSLLSDGYLSDSLDDGGFLTDRIPTRGEAHRDGLMRGLALMAVVAMLIGIGLASSAIHAADAELAPFADDLTQGAIDAH